jgi:hypothetical protein
LSFALGVETAFAEYKGEDAVCQVDADLIAIYAFIGIIYCAIWVLKFLIFVVIFKFCAGETFKKILYYTEMITFILYYLALMVLSIMLIDYAKNDPCTNKDILDF